MSVAPAAGPPPSPALSAAVPSAQHAKRLKIHGTSAGPSTGTIGTAVPCTLERPEDYCVRMEYPFKRFDVLGHEHERAIELFVPFVHYQLSSRSFVQMHGHHDVVVKTITLLKLFGFLANKVTATKPAKTKAAARKRRRGAGDLDPVVEEEGGDFDLAAMANRDGAIGEPDTPPPKITVHVTYERVPHRDNPRVFVGYRLRISESGTNRTAGYGMTHELVSRIKANEDDKAKMLFSGRARGSAATSNRNRPSESSSTEYTTIDSAKWKELCMFYWPTLLSGAEDGIDVGQSNMYDLSCPYNIETVFSIEHSMALARNLGAHPDYCNIAHYCAVLNNEEAFAFPHPENVYWIHESSLNPLRFERRFRPEIAPDPMAHLREAEQYGKLHGLVGDKARQAFDHCAVSTCINEPANDDWALKARISAQVNELRIQHTVHGELTAAYYEEFRKLQRTDWLDQFFEVYSTAGDCPPAIQAICAAEEAYLTQNRNTLCSRVDNCTRNLTRFQEMVAQDLAMFETVLTVDSAHVELFLVLLCSTYCYARTDMNFHSLSLGRPGVGKSFILKILEMLFIPQTVLLMTYFSPKAFAASTKEHAARILVLEDAPASTMGVGAGAGSKGGKDATSDAQNILKSILTTIWLVVQALTMDPARRSEAIVAELGCTLLVAMNDDSSHFEHAILDRFRLTIVALATEGGVLPSVTDAPRPTMLGKSQRSKCEAVRNAMNEMTTLWRRRQMLTCRIWSLIHVGILRDIDISSAEDFFAMVARLARSKGVDMETRNRGVERFRIMVKQLVIKKVIDMYWCSPLSPFEGIPHAREHFLKVEKHLYSTLDQVVLALGMSATEFQDKARASILQAMKKEWFPSSDAKIRIMKTTIFEPEPANGDAAGGGGGYDAFRMDERKHWMYDTCYMGAGGLIAPMPASGNRVPTSEDMLKHIATKLMPLLHKKYQLNEVITRLREMTQDQVQCTRMVRDPEDHDTGYRDEVQMRHQLVVEHDKIRIAYPTLEHANDSDVIYNCTRDVLTGLHRLTTPKPPAVPQPPPTYLYGETETQPGMRHVWRTIQADVRSNMGADEARRICRIANPHFADDATKELTQMQLKSMNSSYGDPKKLDALFAGSTPWITIDVDLDKRSALRRAVQLGLSTRMMNERPNIRNSATEAEMREIYADRARAKGTTLREYPECFVRGQSLQHWDDKFKEANGHKQFSSRREWAELAAQQLKISKELSTVKRENVVA